MANQLKVPFLEFESRTKILENEYRRVFDQFLKDGNFAGNTGEVKALENRWASLTGASYAIALGNGSDALVLAFKCLGIGKDDKVVVPSATFIATAMAVVACGAIPVFADCDPETWVMGPRQLKAALQKKGIKAVIAVHLYGQPCDMDALKAICNEYGCHLIDDCAQAHGAKYKGKPVGSLAPLSAFSFYPTKSMGALGEAGMLCTSEWKCEENARMMRNYGGLGNYHFEGFGLNHRIDPLQAAFLNLHLKFFEIWADKRKQIAKAYRENIKLEGLDFQGTYPETVSVPYAFVISHPRRYELKDYLEEAGIGTMIHYPTPCHLQPAFKYLNYDEGDLPNSEYLAETCLSLPCYPELNESQIDHVINMVNRF